MHLISQQHSGRFYEELPNTADYVSYRLACNKEDYPEPYSPPINPPLSFLPQQPYQSPQPTIADSSSSSSMSKNTFSLPSHTTAIFKYPSVQGLSSPPPGVAAYTFPKEQYVWTFLQTQTSSVSSEQTTCFKPEPFPRGGCCLTPDYQTVTDCTTVNSSGSQGTVQLLFLGF